MINARGSLQPPSTVHRTTVYYHTAHRTETDDNKASIYRPMRPNAHPAPSNKTMQRRPAWKAERAHDIRVLFQDWEERLETITLQPGPFFAGKHARCILRLCSHPRDHAMMACRTSASIGILPMERDAVMSSPKMADHRLNPCRGRSKCENTCIIFHPRPFFFISFFPPRDLSNSSGITVKLFCTG